MKVKTATSIIALLLITAITSSCGMSQRDLDFAQETHNLEKVTEDMLVVQDEHGNWPNFRPYPDPEGATYGIFTHQVVFSTDNIAGRKFVYPNVWIVIDTDTLTDSQKSAVEAITDSQDETPPFIGDKRAAYISYAYCEPHIETPAPTSAS